MGAGGLGARGLRYWCRRLVWVQVVLGIGVGRMRYVWSYEIRVQVLLDRLTHEMLLGVWLCDVWLVLGGAVQAVAVAGQARR